MKNSPNESKRLLFYCFSYYRIKEFNKAVGYFQKAIGADDTISQNAYFHLADCQLS
ncbi:MAG: hypothetical protein IPH33_07725 [Bacteroidetes bacterium]|nr:hypothetical protein [Bacteroidota bacterium]